MTTQVAAPQVGTLDARAQRIVLVGMVALVSLGAFEALAVATAMPAVAVDLGGLREYTLPFAASFAASVVGLLAAGRWCDRSGPSPALWTGVVVFVVGLVVAGTAPSMGVLTAGRAVQGVGSGLYSVALYVLVARVFPAARRPRVFSAFATAWVVPAIVGPALAGLVVEHLGWRWVFLAVPALAVPAAVAMRPGLVAARGTAPGGSEPVADDAPARGARSLGLGIALVRRGLPTVVVVRGLVSAAFTGAEVLLPLVLVHERHLTPAQAGVALTVGAVGWSFASWVRGRDFLRRTPVGYARIGAGLLAAGMLGAAVLVLPGVPAAAGMASWALSGLGMGLVFPTLSVLTLELADPSEQGAASSALQVADAVAGAIASLAAGALLWQLHDAVGLPAYAACFALTAGLALAGAALAGRTRPA